MSITHSKVSAIPDGPDPDVVLPSDWNDDHVIALVDADIPATIVRDSELDAAIAALTTLYQPLDSDLTAIAALTTTTFGRAVLALSSSATLRAHAELVIGVDVPSQAELTALAGRTIHVADYAAVGDGSLEQTELQAAVDAVESGGVLELGGSGQTYLVSGLILTNTAPVVIRGNGAILKQDVHAATVGPPIIEVRGAAVIIDGVDFDGQRTLQPANEFSDSFNSGLGSTGRFYRSAIGADGVTYTVSELTVRQCSFRNIYGSPVATLNVPRLRVLDNNIKDSNFELVYAYSTSQQVEAIVAGNIFSDIASGHGTINANSILLKDYRRCVVRGNVGTDAERNFVKIEGGDLISINDNVFDTNTLSGFAAIQVQNTCARLIIVDNQLYNCLQGITLNHTTLLTSMVIEGNIIDTTTGAPQADGIIWGAAGVDYASISGNVLRNIKRNGISGPLGGGVIKIRDNIISGQALSGQEGLVFNISASITYLDISGNTVQSFQQNAGSGTGMVHLEQSGAAMIALLMFRGNTILGGGSGNRAVRFVDDCVTAGVVTDNYIDGEAIFNSDGLIHRDNVVTGTYTNTRAYAKLPRLLTASKTWDPASVASGAMTSTTVTCTGAAVGNNVTVGFSIAVPAGCLLVGAVTAVNTVTVTLFNISGSPQDLGSGTLRVDCWQH